MRLHFLIAALLSFFMAACTSAPAAPRPGTAAVPSGTLKVHPGLLGQPAPSELRTSEDGAATDSSSKTASTENKR